MKKFAGVCVWLCVILLVAGCQPAAPSTYEAAVTAYMGVYRQGQTDLLEQLAPSAVLDTLKKEKAFDPEERRAAVDEEYEKLMGSLRPIYGDDLTVTVVVTQKETVKEEIAEQVTQKLSQRYGIAEGDVKEVAVAHFTVIHAGESKEKSSEARILVVNVGSGWYACNGDGDFGIEHNMLYY